MPNLTPSEIAEIEKKANDKVPIIMSQREWKDGYITAKLEDAAEIKRLREGIERLINGQHYTMHFESKEAQSAYNEALRNAKQLLNSQP